MRRCVIIEISGKRGRAQLVVKHCFTKIDKIKAVSPQNRFLCFLLLTRPFAPLCEGRVAVFFYATLSVSMVSCSSTSSSSSSTG